MADSRTEIARSEGDANKGRGAHRQSRLITDDAGKYGGDSGLTGGNGGCQALLARCVTDGSDRGLIGSPGNVRGQILAGRISKSPNGIVLLRNARQYGRPRQ